MEERLNADPSRTCSFSRAEGIAIVAASGTRQYPRVQVRDLVLLQYSSSTSGETYWP